jgi:TRAP-type C4-dicarboxylate transport system substrate-binding protein
MRYFWILLISLISIPVNAQIQPLKVITIRIGTIVPERSSWMNQIYRFNEFIKKETKGNLKFIWYTSGVAGDEPEIIEKLKRNELDGAGLSGMGLGRIVPDVRVLELPFLFNDYEEVDYVRSKISPLLSKIFNSKGYELIGWVDQGFVYFFSKEEFRDISQIKGKRVWIWKEDPLAEALTDGFPEVTPYFEKVTVLKKILDEGMVDVIYFPPIGVISFQLYYGVKYVIAPPIVYGLGAFIIKKDVFDSLPDEYKEVIRKGADEFFPQFVREVRRETEESISALNKFGIKKVTLNESTVSELRNRMRKVYDSLIGKLYPQYLLTQVLSTLAQFRVERK